MPSSVVTSSLVTGDQVAKAINKAYHKVTNINTSNLVTEGTGTAKIKAGDTVTFEAGKNLSSVMSDTGLLKVSTKDEVEFKQVTLKDGNNDTVLTTTANGLDVGGNKISNLANGVNDNDAVNIAQLKASKPTVVKGTNVSSVVKTAGTGTAGDTWTVNADGTTVSAGSTAISVTSPNGKNATTNITDYKVDLSPDTKIKLAKALLTEEVTAGDGITVNPTPATATKGASFEVVAKVDGKTIEIDPTTKAIKAKTTTLTASTTDGTVTAADTNALAKATDIANAINKAGFKVKTETGADGKDQLITMGDTVIFDEGDNIDVVQADNKFTIATKKAVQFDKITVGDDKNNAKNNVIIDKTDGISAGSKQIKNVASGLGKTKISDATGDTLNNAVNVSDLKKINTDLVNKGFNIKADNKSADKFTDNKDHVNLGEDVLYTSKDKNIVTTVGENQIDFGLANTITVGDKTKKPVTINGDTGVVSGLTNNITVPTTADTTKVSKPTNVKENNATTVGDVLNTGWNLQGNGTQKDFVQAYDTVDFVNGNATTVTVAQEVDKNTVKVDVNVDDNTLEVVDKKVQAKTTTLTPSKTDGTVTAGDNDALAKAGDIANAINSAGFKVKTENGEGAKDQLITMGDTVIFDEGDNIDVVQADNKFIIKTKKDLIIDSIAKSTTGAKITLGEDKITLAKGTEPVTLTGIKAGTSGTDAVNFTQLETVKTLAGKHSIVSVEGVLDTNKADNTHTQATNLSIKETDNNGQSTFDIKLNDKLTLGSGDKQVVVDGTSGNINTGNIAINGTAGTISGLTNNISVPTTADTTKVSKQSNLTENNVATVGDILNTGWNLQGNGTQKDFVQAYDTVDFVNGNATTVTVAKNADKNTVKVDVNVDDKTLEVDATSKQIKAKTTELTTNTTNGTVNAGDDNALVKASDVANAINNSGFVVTASKEGGNLAGTKEDYLVTAGDKLELVAGEHITIEQTGSKFKFSTNNQKIAEGAQLPVVYTDKQGNKVSLVTKADGSKAFQKSDGTTIANSDVITSMQNADGTTKTPTTLTNVKSTLPNTVNNTLTGDALAQANKSQKLPVLQGNEENNVSTISDVLNTGWNLQENSKDVDFVKAYDSVNFVDGQGTTAKITTDNQVSKVSLDINVDNETLELTKIDPNNPSKGTQITAKTGKIVQDSNNKGQVIAKAGDKNKVATVGDVANAINNAGFVVKTENGEGSKDHLVQSGTKVVINEGDNIDVKQSGNQFTIATKDNPQFNSVQIGNDINNTTLTTSEHGLDIGGSKITNVAKGNISPTSKDAINGSQLYDLGYKLAGDIANNASRANAGIASAIATAGVPQGYIPGKSMLSGAAAYYDGESAVSIGLSKLSDNGKWIFKANGSADTQGKIGGSIGAGFHF
ncbi:MAG: YadA-like family protein [Moraxellaceae bacterium]|nr:YadA-like family protein [Moraxellaceae bacterium]